MIILNSHNKKDNQNDVQYNMSIVLTGNNQKINEKSENEKIRSTQAKSNMTTPLKEDLLKYETSESEK